MNRLAGRIAIVTVAMQPMAEEGAKTVIDGGYTAR